MKKIFVAIILFCVCIASIAQKNKIYATVFDEDNNPIARGIFKSAADSGIIILVDEMEVFVSATEITTLKVEKNPSKAQFLKLGVAATTEVVSYLINKPSNNHESDSMPAEIETQPFSTETKDALFQRIQSLIRNLLDGINDLATFSINNSSEKFITKLRLLQQYSIDKEIVAWNDYSQNQQPANEVNDPQEGAAIQNESSDDQTTQAEQNGQTKTPSGSPKPSMTGPVKSKAVILNKGFYVVKPEPIVAKPTTIQVKNNNQASSTKNVIISSPSKTVEKKQAQTKSVKPVISVPSKKVNKDLKKRISTK